MTGLIVKGDGAWSYFLQTKSLTPPPNTKMQ